LRYGYHYQELGDDTCSHPRLSEEESYVIVTLFVEIALSMGRRSCLYNHTDYTDGISVLFRNPSIVSPLEARFERCLAYRLDRFL
jgi:hypothetical protein